MTVALRLFFCQTLLRPPFFWGNVQEETNSPVISWKLIFFCYIRKEAYMWIKFDLKKIINITFAHLRLWAKSHSYYISTCMQNKSFFWIFSVICLYVILPLSHIKLCLNENEKDYPIDKHINSCFNFSACYMKNGTLTPSIKSNSMCLNYYFSHVFLLVLDTFPEAFLLSHCFGVSFPSMDEDLRCLGS